MCYELEYFLLSGSIKKFDDSILEQTKKSLHLLETTIKTLPCTFIKLPDDFGKSLENIFYTQEMFIIYLCPWLSCYLRCFLKHILHKYFLK